MPPKKKKDDGKKREKKGTKKLSGPPAPEILNEHTKEFYLAQIRDLESRIARYQKKCDELEVKNGEFRQQFDQMAENKKDIVAFIKKKLDEKTDEISDLNDRLVGLQQSKDQEREMFEQQLQQLRTEYRETKEQLTSENMVLSGKLASLDEFKVKREDLMAQTAKLESLLAEREEQHREAIYNLEKKQVIDKDRLKKEMVMRVNQVAAEFRKASNRQMAETTKRTIRENVAVNSQLAKMSDKTTELITTNDELKDKERRQRQEIEILLDTEKELTKKNLANQKIIQMLIEKCRTQEQELEGRRSVADTYNETDAELIKLREELDKARSEVSSLTAQNQELEQANTSAQKSLRERARMRRNLEKVLEEASHSLKEVLSPSIEDQYADSQFDVTSKRVNMLKNLLSVLNSAADLGFGPSLADMRIKLDKPELDADDSNQDLQQRVQSSPQQRPHYQLGDLGFVPRPEQHTPTTRTAWSVESSKLQSSQKPAPIRSTSTQTASAVKAMFFADQHVGHHSSSDNRRTTPKLLPSLVTPSPKPVISRAS